MVAALSEIKPTTVGDRVLDWPELMQPRLLPVRKPPCEAAAFFPLSVHPSTCGTAIEVGRATRPSRSKELFKLGAWRQNLSSNARGYQARIDLSF